MFLHVIGFILMAALLCWIANMVFPTNVPRPIVYLGIFVVILAAGGYFDRGNLFPH